MLLKVSQLEGTKHFCKWGKMLLNFNAMQRIKHWWWVDGVQLKSKDYCNARGNTPKFISFFMSTKQKISTAKCVM